LSPNSQKKQVHSRVILPLDGRADGEPAESVFVNEHREDISLVGEIFRKLIHLGAISIPLAYYFLAKEIILLVLYAALLISLSIDYIRIYGGKRGKKFVSRYLGIMIRPHEKKNFIGATYILTGSILTILFFDKPIAITAISYIVIGDTAGSIIGRLWGKVRYRNKSLEGSISFFMACSLIALIIPGIQFWVKISGALAATIVEAITLHIDDNLIVPVTSGAIMQLIISQIFIINYFS
jgi:dolichol kinase